ncbi:MAG: acetoacetate--CoA ligase, partial [Thermoleophilaceae bacterium]
MADRTQSEPLWTPDEERIARSNVTAYARWLAQERDVETDRYHELWQWSVDNLDDFWKSIWDYYGVRADQPYDEVLASRAMPGAQWFTGARLSYAEHVLRGHDDGEIALHHASELRELDTVTWGELRAGVAALAGGLRNLGVGPGDRVVAYMPNIAEAITAFLACASIGAVWSSASPDFGAKSVVDRFAQIEPKVLLAVDGYRYNGRDFDRMDTVASLQEQIPTLEHTVLLGYLDSVADPARLSRAIGWDELLGRGEGSELRFEALPFEHPLWVLYSSGTTGLPKAIVHSQGGILLEHLKKMNLHLDAQPGDRVFWFTTTGWMMWNFLVGVLLTPAQIVLYDGSPGHPDLGVLWDLAERTGTTTFGTSAAFISSCMKAGIEAGRDHDLSALRAVGSTGSPLSPEGFRWIYDHVGGDTWLFSTSGGTDVCTAFVGGVPVLPVHVGELQCRALGCSVEAWDEDGHAVVGEVGELVLTEPMPSMPIALLNDPDGERMRESYYEMFPGVWRHGDWIEITPAGSAIIYGRSDSTINRGGVRMGTSEIYRAVLDLDEITDALVVDVPTAGEENWMPLFVVLRDGAELDDHLTKAIAKQIREYCSPRHVPNDVYAVDEVPRTLSGKV